jgi:GTP-binding protein
MHIISAQYLTSSPDYTKCPPANRPEYAFIGRSNVGKSSLINMLCDNQKLAKTSGTPGKTQLINHFDITSTASPSSKTTRHWYMVDLPGYGFAKVSQRDRNRWEQMIEHYLRKRENLLTIFVLIDSRHAPQKIDLQFVNQLGAWEVPFNLLFTKADKENQRAVAANVKAFLNAMRAEWEFLPAHVVTSAVKKQGKDKVLSLIDEMNSGFNGKQVS